ncbi:hypothetical protein CA13_12240 [Planctomycetes bacterium CA13]|uniref:Sulfatase n=1 Tax=Novipirellula herctigrandis TaxID=2527986 RepID=A0A5C5YYY3_9BACT|nr:hypothetical protein CA13_12240 [Planctomycetes bacterium CA13]
MTNRKLIVISAEGLATAALGCYGSSWNPTPAIDAIAAEGVLWDRLIATRDDPVEVVRQIWANDDASPTWLDAWRANGPVELMSDNLRLNDNRFTRAFDTALFVRREPPTASDPPCEEIEETLLAELFASLLDRIEGESPWSAIWLHTQSLATVWDAPRWLIPDEEQDIDEEEPSEETAYLPDPSAVEASDSTAPPPWIHNQVTPPMLQLASNEHPDAIVSWMRTYGCQVQLFDQMIGLLMDVAEPLGITVVLLGTSGMSLGQNGWIGHRAGPLRSCHHRLPLIIGRGAPIRNGSLTCATDIAKILADMVDSNRAIIDPAQWPKRDDEYVPRVETSSSDGEYAVTTSRWYMVQQNDGKTPLFLKPDDVEDHNDVSRVRPDVIDKLQ